MHRKGINYDTGYASGTWENANWSLFDLVGVDHYQDASNRSFYREQLRPYFLHQRPVVVTEFGCCTYRGAQDRGAMGWAIVDRDARPSRLSERVMRDEQVQVAYLRDVLKSLNEEGVDGAFWFTFASYGTHCLMKIFLSTLQSSLFFRFFTDLSSKTAQSLIIPKTGEAYGIREREKRISWRSASKMRRSDIVCFSSFLFSNSLSVTYHSKGKAGCGGM